MALTKVAEFLVKARAVGTKKVQTQVTAMASTVEGQGARVDKILRGQAKLTRRLAAQNKKAFTLAAVGMGPLIRAYANVAASIFALGGVWDAVNIGAKFKQTSESFSRLSAGFGVDSKLIIADLKGLAGGALTTQDIMEQAALGIASGLSTVQLEKLTVVARKAAKVMGRTLPDSFSRLIKGVTKLEPELLDELGITTKLGPALIKYAKATGQAVTNVTQFEKVQLFANLAAKEGERKFKDIDVSVLSYSERLQGLKTRLIDYSTEMAAKAIPVTTQLFEALAASSSQIVILASAYGIYKAALAGSTAATRSLSAANGLAISLEKQQSKNIVAITNAKLELQTVIAEEAAAEKVLTKAKIAELGVQKEVIASNIAEAESTIALTAAERRLAEIRIAELEQQRLLIAGNIAEAESTTFLAVAKRRLTVATGLFGKALGFVSKRIIPLLIVFEIARAFGALDKIWELMAGKTVPTLQEKVDSLTKSQLSLSTSMGEMGIETEAAVDKVLAGDVSLSDFSDTTKVLSDRASGLVTIMVTLGKLKFITTAQNAAVAALNTKSENLRNVIKSMEERIKNAPKEGWLIKFLGKGTDIDLVKTALIDVRRELKATEDASKGATEGIVAKAAKTLAFVTSGQSSSATVQEGLSAAGEKNPVADSLTKKEKAQSKVDALAKIDVAKALTIQIDSLSKAMARKKELEAEILSQGDDVNVATQKNLTNQKAFIKLTKERITIDKAIPALLKKRRAELAKLNKPVKSVTGLTETAAVAAQIQGLKAKKSLQTKDVVSTSNYFDKLGSLEQTAFELSKTRLEENIKSGFGGKEKSTAALTKLTAAHKAEVIRIETEQDNILIENQKSALNATFENESLALADRLQAKKDFDQLVLEQLHGSAEEKAALVDKQNRDSDIFRDGELAKTGTFFESLIAQANSAARDAKSIGATFADAFVKAGSIIQDALVNKVGTALGLLTDVAKTQFAEQLQAAQESFQAMVVAANEALTGSLNSGSLSADRALEDLKLKRERQVSDLTAQRDTGAITGDQFSTGLGKIDTQFNRGKQDIGISKGRGEEDANKKRQKSLLGAQKKLNKELLKANKLFAKENGKVWDSMNEALKKSTFSLIVDILMAEGKQIAISLANKATAAAVELGLISAKTGASLTIKGAEAIAGGTMSGGEALLKFAADLGPVGLAVGAVAIGGLIAALVSTVSSASKPIPVPTMSVPSFKPTAPAFHTGGLITGSQTEVPIIAMSGEGILNKHNGMNAIGGQRGLNSANATGSLPEASGGTPVTIQFVSQDGEVRDSLTVDNFEDFLRNQGSRQMHAVSADGYIMLDKQSVTGL